MPTDYSFAGIAARSDIAPKRWRRPFLRWLDGVESGWAVPLLLIGFVAIWTTFLAIAYLCGDLHPDVLEAWTFGRTFEWGNLKHPPLMGWIARTWTSVFPITDWSFQLLAMSNSALALWAVDLISRRFVIGDKRVIVLLLLMLMPTYQFLAQRFNANAVLLATWPIATYCFLRSFESRQVGWAIAAGASAAFAMLGKYYTAFLVASFLFAAVSHPQRRNYFGSSAPWISLVTGLVALGPHIYWLATTGAMPIEYALMERSGKALGNSFIESLLFVVGLFVAMAIPALAWGMIAGHRLKSLSRDFRAMKPGLLLLFLIGIGTIVFPAITSVALRTDMPSIWAVQGLFLFVIVVVCGASYSIERFYAVSLAALVLGSAVAAVVIVAPVHALYRNTHPLGEDRNFYRLSAYELTRLWHQHSDVALPAVGGNGVLALGMAFYSADHPPFEMRLVCPKNERMPQAKFDQGWAAICAKKDALCIDSMERIAARTSRVFRSEFVVQSTLFGQGGATRDFKAIIVPPAVQGTVLPARTEDIEEIVAIRCSGKKPD